MMKVSNSLPDIAVLRGGTKNFKQSLQEGAEVLSSLTKIGYEPVDVLIDKEGEWTAHGAPTDPHKVFTKSHTIIDTTRMKGEAYQSLARKMQIPLIFSEDETVSLNREDLYRILRQQDIKVPDTFVVHLKMKYSEIFGHGSIHHFLFVLFIVMQPFLLRLFVSSTTLNKQSVIIMKRVWTCIFLLIVSSTQHLLQYFQILEAKECTHQCGLIHFQKMGDFQIDNPESNHIFRRQNLEKKTCVLLQQKYITLLASLLPCVLILLITIMSLLLLMLI